MFRGLLILSFQVGACAAVGSLTVTPCMCQAQALKTTRACWTAYEDARQHEQAAQLREAKHLWQACANAACGSRLRETCATKSSQLDSDIPSIVPIVTDSAGAPRLDIEVRMDGRLLASRLDGRALPIDPGLHEFIFNALGGASVTQTLLVAQGQRNLPVLVSFADKRPSHAASRRAAPTDEQSQTRPAAQPTEASAARLRLTSPATSGPSVLPYVLGGTGLAGLGGFAWLVAWGRQDNDRLQSCSPNCSRASLDHIRTLYVASDISLGIAIAALGAATWLLITQGRASDKAPRETAFNVHLQPTRSGALANFAGSF